MLGAFIAGVVIARSRFADHDLIRPVETMTAAVFAPVFFATAGLRVDLGLLADAETLLWAVIVLAAASASKFVGSLLGARLSLLPAREGAALGIGLNARGALEIVIATVGLSLGVLNDRSYTVIVLMAMATSMAAPPLLRQVLRNWEGTPEERRRLDLEAQLATNTLVSGGRLLVPSRGDPPSLLAAQVAALAWPSSTEITVLTAGSHPTGDLAPLRSVFADQAVEHRWVDNDDAAEAILEEAVLGYDAIVVGTDHHPLSPLVETLLRHSPVPVVVVRPPVAAGGRLPWAFSRAIVPVSGRRSSRPAQEIGAYLSAAIGTRLHQLHVTPDPSTRLELLLNDHAPHTNATRGILDDAAALATTAGANVTSLVEHGDRPGSRILQSAAELDADLIVISGTSRINNGQLFLGHTLDHVLEQATDATVVLAVIPERVPAVAGRVGDEATG